MALPTGASPRVLVIGLDMGDGRLIRHWSAEGRLPHLAALAASGTWFDLDSPAAALHTSTWPTFATGTLPGRHGVYYPYQPTPGRQIARHIGPDQYGEPTFWRRASDSGRRAVVYDVPETFPEPGYRGRAIFDWGTWAWYGEPATQPPALAARLKQTFGPYPLGFEAKKLALNIPDHIEQRLLRSVEYTRASAQWLLDEEPWDLGVVGFCETHPAGHYLWPAGVASVETGDAGAFAPLFHVYQAIDTAIGALHDRLPPDATLFVVSGDGVRPNHCGWHLLPGLMARLGYVTSRRPAPAAPPATTDGAATAEPPRPSAVQQMIARARRQVSNLLPWRVRDRIGVWMQTAGIDWSRTRAFTLQTDLEGCIRINLKGREPHGIVSPGAEYDALCAEIRTELEALVNPVTGAPAVRHVWIRNEVFPGPKQDELPDIVVTWNDEAPITALHSPRLGTIAGVNPDPRTGTHSIEGFLLASGPAFAAGAHARGRLTDVAPTVLSLLGSGGADALDGAPLDSSAGSTGTAQKASNGR
jgi:predicted AlkP superfamily phosphohydrolase/phosphomutase